MTPRPLPPERIHEAAMRLRHFGINEASGNSDAIDPTLAAFHRGERAGLRAAEREYGRGFYDGVLTALVCITIGASIVVIATWIFTR